MSVADLYRNRGVNPLAVAGATITFPSTADTLIAAGANADTNFSTGVGFQCTPDTVPAWSLIAFDVSAAFPKPFTVVVATLRLYTYVVAASRTITAYRLLRTTWVENQATWNIYKTGSSWGTVGCGSTTTDYTIADAATSASVAVSIWQEWDITKQVQTAIDSVSGKVHIFLKDAGSVVAVDNAWRSKEYTTESLRPQLVVYGHP